uniref:HECT-type E3 ubiquitin transferase n=1 Tax=Heterorhabditis bacteriophora TaxID=37862 RepID=A0A1I7XFR9_HETBA
MLYKNNTSINDARFNLFGFELFVEQPFFELTVRRDHIIHDTLNGLATGKKYLQRPLKVQFMNEEAEDAGGVKKEFFMILFQKILQSDYGMFTEDENSHLVWFSGFSGFEEELENYRMVGTLCGLAVYNSILVAFPFPLALYKVLLDQQPTLEDLCELSPVEGRSLQELLDYQGDDFETISFFKDVFCLTFTFSCTALGQTETVDLKTEGSKITVTQLNKNEYVQLYVRNRLLIGLNGEIGRQANAFKDGFRMVANSRVVSFFQPRELMELVVGNENYDWTEFKKIHSTVYP